MSPTSPLSPVRQANARMQESKRRQEKVLAELAPRSPQGKLEEDDAKRIAAAIMEIMKQSR